MKTIEETYAFLLQRLRICLFRPSMCGGELGILNLFEYLTFVDERAEEWFEHRTKLRRSKAFLASGVNGGFAQLHHNHKAFSNEHLVASVYAQIAFEMGYLTLAENGERYGMTRLIKPAEYELMRCQVAESLNANDDSDGGLRPDDILERFGACSIRWGTNDYYPCTLTYLVDGDPAAFVHFDFWAEWFRDESGVRVPCKHGPKPLLRNVRVPAETFREQFLFTSFGKSLREVGK